VSFGSPSDKARNTFVWMFLVTMGGMLSFWAAARNTGEWQKFFLAMGGFCALVWLALFTVWRAYRKRS